MGAIMLSSLIGKNAIMTFKADSWPKWSKSGRTFLKITGFGDGFIRVEFGKTGSKRYTTYVNVDAIIDVLPLGDQ